VPEKQRGTSDVTLVAEVNSYETVAHLRQRFGARSQETGTLVITGVQCEEVPADQPDLDPPTVRVRLRYRHTCKNRGNHEWDARRFFEKALPDEDEWHYGFFEHAELNSWEPS
jgi:hypothetical protein